MKVSHTCLLVHELDGSLAFYSLLGFEERRRLGDGQGQSVFCGLPGDEDRLQLGIAPSPLTEAVQFGHLAIEVEDLDATLQLLAEHQIRPDQAPVQAGSVRLCFVHDPDGYAIELLEQVASGSDR